MTPHIPLSLSKAFTTAWNIYKQNARFFLIVSTLVFFFMLLIGWSTLGVKGLWLEGFLTLTPIQRIIFAFIVGLQELYIYQLLKYSRAMEEGHKVAWYSFFSLPDRNFISFFLARLRFTIILIIGLFLLIIPGVLYLCSNFFAGYSIIHFLTDSLKKDASISSILTKNNRLRILLFFLLVVLVRKPLGPLFIFTLPLEALMMLAMYKQLMRGKEEKIKALTPLSDTAPNTYLDTKG